MEFGTWLLYVALAYGLGVFWYDLLPARLPDMPWRVAAYPFVLMIIGEAFLPLGPEFAGVHPITAVIASFVGVVIDWVVTQARQPEAIPSLERRRAAAAA
ncbi:MAG TPA: hypothetical protein VNM66_04520 [Thermodesulfobacteriota bacterium]|nr:hypothetical protein [Thermodesulfobacteriota bacterium]